METESAIDPVIAADEIADTDGIPVTTPARTLLDLATVLPPHSLERAIEEAEILRLADDPPAAPSSTTARATAGSKPPGGAWSASPGGSCTRITKASRGS